MIKIDIEVPESCEHCPCIKPWIGSFELEFTCGVNHKRLENVKKRPKWCKLIECEE